MTYYKLDQLDTFPWIVSCDTLRTEDLLPKFWQAAETCAVLADRPQLLNPETLANLERLVGEESVEAAWSDTWGGIRGDTWARITLGELHDALNDAAPAGFHFSSSEGDGACFGFWLSEDWIAALEHCGWAADSDPAALADVIRELEQDGINCDNAEDAYCGQADGCTEERAGEDYAQTLFDESGIRCASQDGWPFRCIDWQAAWDELRMSDGYSLHRISGDSWAVFRAV